MRATDLHLAEINVATLVAPLDDPQIDDFRDALDEVNALAEASPGFVWRLQTDDGNATAIQAFPNPLTIVNLSVWESPEANSVTWCPRRTSSSVSTWTTRSVPPYPDGGTRSSGGAICAIRSGRPPPVGRPP